MKKRALKKLLKKKAESVIKFANQKKGKIAIVQFETAEEILTHGNEQQGKQRPLKACFWGIKNPEKAYIVASALVAGKNSHCNNPTRETYHRFKEDMQKILDENEVPKYPGDYGLCDDRIVRYQPICNLFKSFESDIIYDCHQIRTRASRSTAGKEIIRRGRESLSALAENLVYQRDFNSDVFTGLIMILYWLGHKHGIIENMPQTFGDADGWIEWAKINATT